MKLQLIDLTQVSLNTQLTQQVLNCLDAKLDDTEKRNFQQWLVLVRQRIRLAEQNGERRGMKKGIR